MRRRVVAAVLLAGLAGGAAATTARAAPVQQCGATRTGDWTRLPLPSDVQPAISVAVAVHHPSVLLAARAGHIDLSLDAGCSWSTVVALDAPAASAGTTLGQDTIESVVLSDTATSTPRAYAVLSEHNATAGTRVMTSADAGRHWSRGVELTAAGSPAPLTSGIAQQLGVDPRDSAHAVLPVCDVPSGLVCQPSLWVTHDAGASWTHRAEVPSGDQTQPASEVWPVFDPSETRRFWLPGFVQPRLRVSTDDGSTIGFVGPAVRGPGDLVAGPGGRLTEVTDASLLVSQDGGEHLATSGLPAVGDTKLALSTDGRWVLVQVQPKAQGSATAQYRRPLGKDGLPVTGSRWSVVTAPVAPTLRFHLTTDASSRVWGYTRTDVWRYDGLRSASQNSTGMSPVAVRPARLPALTAPAVLRLRAPGSVDVPAGTSTTVPLSALVPSGRGPLDLVFLVDGTGSMASSVSALQQLLPTLVGELTARGVRARYGVAAFGEYALAQYGGAEADQNVPYRLLRDLGPPDDGLAEAFDELSNGTGGSFDDRTSLLPALHQLLTGAGQVVGTGGGADIPAGQQVHLDPVATKVVVVVTDRPPHEPPGYPGPALTSVVSDLRSRGVRALGLDVADGPAAQLRGVDALTRLAVGSGAVAPAPGVDCDGDGAPDLRTGQPLVCSVTTATQIGDAGAVGSSAAPAAFGNALVALLDGSAVRRPITFGVRSSVVRSELEGARVTVGTAAAVVGGRLRVHCPNRAVSADVGVDVVSPGLVGASSAVRVTCLAAAGTAGLGGPVARRPVGGVLPTSPSSATAGPGLAAVGPVPPPPVAAGSAAEAASSASSSAGSPVTTGQVVSLPRTAEQEQAVALARGSGAEQSDASLLTLYAGALGASVVAVSRRRGRGRQRV